MALKDRGRRGVARRWVASAARDAQVHNPLPEYTLTVWCVSWGNVAAAVPCVLTVIFALQSSRLCRAFKPQNVPDKVPKTSQVFCRWSARFFQVIQNARRNRAWGVALACSRVGVGVRIQVGVRLGLGRRQGSFVDFKRKACKRTKTP